MSKTIFVLSDQHYAPPGCPEGGVDPKAESCALQAANLVKPDILVNIGDAGEWNSVSHHKFKKIKRPPIRYVLEELEKDAEAVNSGLDLWDKAVGKGAEKHFIEGNHEVWIDNLCEEIPQLSTRGPYSVRNLLRLEERGHKYHPYGRYVKFGHLWMYHGGHWGGKYHAQRHLENLGANIMYGHTHDQKTAKKPTLGGHHGAWSIGCIADMDKKFLKGRPTDWSHTFAIVHLESNREFHVEIVEIYDGKCYVWGKKVAA